MKTVWVQAHGGSNPSACANAPCPCLGRGRWHRRRQRSPAVRASRRRCPTEGAPLGFRSSPSALPCPCLGREENFPTTSSVVKTRRYKQDAKPADLPQGVYQNVNNQGKTQRRQCIAPYIRVSHEKNHKSSGDKEAPRFVHRRRCPTEGSPLGFRSSPSALPCPRLSRSFENTKIKPKISA